MANKKITLIVVLAVFAIITTAAWASHEKLLLPFPGQPLFPQKPATNDTTPKKGKENTSREKKERERELLYERDLDKAFEDLESALINLKLALKNRNWEKLNEDMKRGWKEYDFDRLGPEIDARMKVDWEKAERDMKKAMKEFESNMNMQELMLAKDEALRGFEMEKLHHELDRAKLNMQHDFDKMQHDFDKMGDELNHAQENLLHAEVEMKNLKSFIDELKKDGLIRKGQGYEVKIEDGELYIDGKKQPASVTEKYRKFFEKDNNFRIKSDGNDDDDWL